MNAAQIIKPDPDSHYRLKPCECGSVEVGYQKTDKNLGAPLWRVKCTACGKTCPARLARHTAQIEWNGGKRPSWDRD